MDWDPSRQNQEFMGGVRVEDLLGADFCLGLKFLTHLKKVINLPMCLISHG